MTTTPEVTVSFQNVLNREEVSRYHLKSSRILCKIIHIKKEMELLAKHLLHNRTDSRLDSLAPTSTVGMEMCNSKPSTEVRDK